METAKFVFIILSFAVSITSIVISVYSYIRNSRIAIENTRLSNASVELELRALIRECKKDFSEIEVQLLPLQKKKKESNVISDDEKIQLEVLLKKHEIVKEELLNSYEEACFKYIDNKIDRTRFKKTYIREIKNIVENKNFKIYIDTIDSPYEGIKKVYKEWNNLEK